MSYQDPQKPRFYIDTIEYIKAVDRLSKKHTEKIYYTLLSNDFYEWLDEDHGTVDEFDETVDLTTRKQDSLFGLNPYQNKTTFGSGDYLGLPMRFTCRFEFPFDIGGGPSFEREPYAKIKMQDINKYFNYIAYLGHNFHSGNNFYLTHTENGSGDMFDGSHTEWTIPTTTTFGSRFVSNFEDLWFPDHVNDFSSTNLTPDADPDLYTNQIGFHAPYDGFSIETFENINTETGAPLGDVDFLKALEFTWYGQEFAREANEPNLRWSSNGFNTLGSISAGKYYDILSPDLKMSFERDFDGVDLDDTIDGATTVNIRHSGSPKWANGFYPWELNKRKYLGNTTINPDGFTDPVTGGLFPRVGRRVWSLTWTERIDDDVMAAYESETTFPYHSGSEDIPTQDNTLITEMENPILESNNFFSQVILKTFHGRIPFIFQPDSDNNSPDQFALCKISDRSFRLRSRGHNVYDMRVTIEEIW